MKLNFSPLFEVRTQRPPVLPGGAGSLIQVTETTRQAIETVQSTAPQTMTALSETALFQTPTMSFGEVGETHKTEIEGTPFRAAGVGKAPDVKMLERAVEVAVVNWVSTSNGQLYVVDLNAFICNYARNSAILSQYCLMRAGIEVTIRLNSTQFYYGQLMASMWPTNGTGVVVDERAIQDPTTISATVSNAVIKKVPYMFPDAWMDIHQVGNGQYPVYLSLDVFAPLTVASNSATETVSVQIWARYTDVELSFPSSTDQLEDEIEAQSGPIVKVPKKGGTKHPFDAGEIMAALNTVAAPDQATVSETLIKTLPTWGPMALEGLAMVLDKPDRSEPQTPIIQEPSIDLFTTDIPDSNVCISTYKQRYVDPSPVRCPMSKTMTVSDYARIPGIRTAHFTFNALGNNTTINLIQAHPDSSTLRCPIDYAVLSHGMWRGGIKVALQFVTSSFISARFVVQYTNARTFPLYPADYTAGISRIIDVKGDTIDTFMCPWLNSNWWADETQLDPQIKVTCISNIVSNDLTTSPKIYMLCWVAGAEDIQFAYPKVIADANWSGSVPNEEEIVAQSGEYPIRDPQGRAAKQALSCQRKLYEKRMRDFNVPMRKPTQEELACIDEQLQAMIGFRLEDFPDREEILVPDGGSWQLLGVEQIPCKEHGGDDEIVPQCSIGTLFKETFPPIGEGVEFQTDTGLCTSEMSGPITDICKRYSPLITSSVVGAPAPRNGVPSTMLDFWSDSQGSTTNTQAYAEYWRFRHTLYGAWRNAFLFQSGGYRYRAYHASSDDIGFIFKVQGNQLNGTIYFTPPDKVSRITVPQVSYLPYRYLAANESTDFYGMINLLVGSGSMSTNTVEMLAARDDLMLGFPIIPSFITPVGVFQDPSKAKVPKKGKPEGSKILRSFDYYTREKPPRGQKGGKGT